MVTPVLSWRANDTRAFFQSVNSNVRPGCVWDAAYDVAAGDKILESQFVLVYRYKKASAICIKPSLGRDTEKGGAGEYFVMNLHALLSLTYDPTRDAGCATNRRRIGRSDS
jgi:hypothetical protein